MHQSHIYLYICLYFREMNTELSRRMSCASWQQACNLLWVSCHSSSPGSTSSTHCLVIKENHCKSRGGPNKSDQSYQWSSARLAVHVNDWVQLHGWAFITVSSNLWLNDSGLMNRGKVGTSPHPPAFGFFSPSRSYQFTSKQRRDPFKVI